MHYRGKALNATIHSRAGKQAECSRDHCCGGAGGGCCTIDLKVDLRRISRQDLNAISEDLLNVAMHMTPTGPRVMSKPYELEGQARAAAD